MVWPRANWTTHIRPTYLSVALGPYQSNASKWLHSVQQDGEQLVGAKQNRDQEGK